MHFKPYHARITADNNRQRRIYLIVALMPRQI